MLLKGLLLAKIAMALQLAIDFVLLAILFLVPQHHDEFLSTGMTQALIGILIVIDLLLLLSIVVFKKRGFVWVATIYTFIKSAATFGLMLFWTASFILLILSLKKPKN